MIVKSLSRSNSSTGQLLQYVFRYVLEKEPKDAPEKESKERLPPLTKAEVPELLEEFLNGNLNFEEEPDTVFAAHKELAELELNDAMLINKNTALGKELKAREKAHGRDLQKTTVHLSRNYVIVRNQHGERFFRLSLPTLFSGIKPVVKEKEKPFVIRHNIRSRSIKGYVREFEKVEGMRLRQRSNQVTVYHNILSLSTKDMEHITDDVLRDLGQKFIEMRGPNNLWVGTKHTDQENTVHLHMVMSGVDMAGRSTRISKAKFAELKIQLDSYQKDKYPGLKHSLPDHGKEKKVALQKVFQKNIKTQRTTDKVTLLKVLETTFEKSTSKEHFIAQLKEQGYPAYYRSGTLTGLTVDGNRKFRLSKLGYGQEKLHHLDLNRELEEKKLTQLRALRENRTQERIGRSIGQVDEKDVEMISINDRLAEFQSVREQAENTSTPTKEESKTEEVERSSKEEDAKETEAKDQDRAAPDEARNR